MYIYTYLHLIIHLSFEYLLKYTIIVTDDITFPELFEHLCTNRAHSQQNGNDKQVREIVSVYDPTNSLYLYSKYRYVRLCRSLEGVPDQEAWISGDIEV